MVPITVLVVDDEEVVRAVTSRMLAHLGATAWMAATGEEALRALGHDGAGVDVVLLDLGLPGCSGDEVLAELQRRRVPVRVLVASGYADATTAAAALANGAAGFVAKPYSVQSLGEALRAAMAAPT